MARVPPGLVDVLEVANYTTSTDPKTTDPFDVEEGDRVVAWVAAENADVPPFAVSGGDLTWTERETEDSNSNQRPMGRMYTAPVDEAKSMTVTFDREGSNSREWGWGVVVLRGSEGIGNTGSTNNGTGSGEPLLNLTTAKDNSAIVALVVDWNVDSGASTWRTGAGAATEVAEYQGGEYSVYAAVHEDAGAAGAKALGMTVPDGQRYVILAVEVLGAEAAEEPTEVAPTPLAESDALQVGPIAKAAAPAALEEASSLQALGIRKLASPAALLEAGSLAAAATVRVAITPLTEADVLLALSPARLRAPVPFTDLSALQPPSATKRAQAAALQETGALGPAAAAKHVAGGILAEAGVLTVPGARKLVAAATLLGADELLELSLADAIVVFPTPLSEAGALIGPGAAKRVTAAALSESDSLDTARLRKAIAAAPLLGADTLLAGRAARLVIPTALSSSDGLLAPAIAKLAASDPLLEAGSLLAPAGAKRVAVLPLTETDVLLVLTVIVGEIPVFLVLRHYPATHLGLHDAPSTALSLFSSPSTMLALSDNPSTYLTLKDGSDMKDGAYDIGDKPRMWAAFTSRALTIAELKAWYEQGTLPDGIGVNPKSVVCTVLKPNGETLTPAVSSDEDGIFWAEVSIDDDSESWFYAYDGSEGFQASGEGFLDVNKQRVPR